MKNDAKPLEWFIERIGKRVYRHNNICDCLICLKVFEFGTVIQDKKQANYLYACQSDLQLIYSDTKLDNA